jgi:hypothetical protein
MLLENVLDFGEYSLVEGFVNLFTPSQKTEYVDVVWDMLQS